MRVGQGTLKSQSAMEYLMTYGWAILIIAIVLAALFSLGVFGSGSFSARVPPGSCQVFRPQGPGTTTNLNLQGTCVGIIPQYVAQFTPGNYVSVPFSSTLQLATPFTVSMWMRPTTATAGISIGDESYPNNGFGMFNNYPWSTYYLFRIEPSGSPGGSCTTGVACISTSQVSSGAWHMLTGVDDGTYVKLYLDGALVNTQIQGNTLLSNQRAYYLGSGTGLGANFQIYSNALDAAAVQALYQEGIGGAPIEPQYLLGWWPMNGDANDYSGNGNNGSPVGNVVYTTSWTSGYSPA